MADKVAIQHVSPTVPSLYSAGECRQSNAMYELKDKQTKMEFLRQYFTPLIGEKLSAFETAQLKLDDEWDHWFDLPIRLYYGRDAVVSIAWTHFDNLFISQDETLNFEIDSSEVRWVSNNLDIVKPAMSGTLKSVQLGLGDLRIDDRDVEIWTRLLLEHDNGWLEVFNDLDQNGFHFHRTKPSGNFVHCCQK